MAYQSLQTKQLQIWLEKQEQQACLDLDIQQWSKDGITDHLTRVFEAYERQPWYRRWWQWWTQPLGSWQVLRLVYQAREKVTEAQSGLGLSNALRVIAKRYGWSWRNWYLSYRAYKIEKEGRQMEKEIAQTEDKPLAALAKLFRQVLQRLEATGFLDKNESKELEEKNFDHRFNLAQEIVSQRKKGKACGWLGRCREAGREERRQLYGSLIHSLLKKLLFSMQAEPEEPAPAKQIELLGQLLEEGLLLGEKDVGSPIFFGTKEQMVWLYYRNLAGRLVQWAQTVKREQQLANDYDHQPFISRWLEMTAHLQQNWHFKIKSEDSYETFPKPENSWLRIEKKVNDFEQRITGRLSQLKKSVAKKIKGLKEPSNDLNKDVKKEESALKELKEQLTKLLTTPTVSAAEALCQSITSKLEELAGKKQLMAVAAEKPSNPPPRATQEEEDRFLFTSKATIEACVLLQVDPKQYLTLNQIKKAFRERARYCHPDKAQLFKWAPEEAKEATEQFKALYNAMETLIAAIEKGQETVVGGETSKESYCDVVFSDWAQMHKQCDVLRQELREIAREIEQLWQQFEQRLEQRLEQQRQLSEQEHDNLLTFLKQELAVSDEQKVAIEQYRQAQQKSREAKPPEFVAASSSGVELPQGKKSDSPGSSSYLPFFMDTPPPPANDGHLTETEDLAQIKAEEARQTILNF
jgi:hypothetical protein